jgi:small subunit ribosomal protein S2
MSSVISMKALLESGVHFGHRTNKWHPAMRPYIFTERNGIHIIDLQQTAKSLNTVYALVRDTVQAGENILFIGTKRQAQETIREEAIRCDMPYVTERWLGGTLTNWSTIYQRILELEKLEKMKETGEILKLTKKEGLMIERNIARLQLRLSGLRHVKTLPALVFVIDVMREATAIHEANLKNIPVIAMVDTNCNPSDVDYVIPSNDDAIRAIKLVVSKIADAVIEGRALREDGDFGDAMFSSETVKFDNSKHLSSVDTSEMDDEDLFGAATLAKIGNMKAAAVEEEKEEAEETEKVSEPEVEAEEEKVEKKATKSKAKPKAKAEVEEANED